MFAAFLFDDNPPPPPLLLSLFLSCSSMSAVRTLTPFSAMLEQWETDRKISTASRTSWRDPSAPAPAVVEAEWVDEAGEAVGS